MWPFYSKPNPKKEELLKEYEQLLPRMYKSVTVKTVGTISCVRTVIEISRNESGKLGYVVANNWKDTACAVHEINRDGTFSKKGFYWTKKKWFICNPRCFAICHILIDKSCINPLIDIRQQACSLGQNIVEMNTSYLPTMSFSNWKLYFGKL